MEHCRQRYPNRDRKKVEGTETVGTWKKQGWGGGVCCKGLSTYPRATLHQLRVLVELLPQIGSPTTNVLLTPKREISQVGKHTGKSKSTPPNCTGHTSLGGLVVASERKERKRPGTRRDKVFPCMDDVSTTVKLEA